MLLLVFVTDRVMRLIYNLIMFMVSCTDISVLYILQTNVERNTVVSYIQNFYVV